MPWYEYQCADGHVTERKGGLEEALAPCSTCAEPARRREFNLVAIVGEMKEQKYPVSRYMEAKSELDYQYEKENVRAPNLWKIAQRKAAL